MKKYCFLVLALMGLGIGEAKAQLAVLYNFDGNNSATPWGDLTLSGGIFYGMTAGGGTNNVGSIFSIDTNGSGYKDIFNFNGISGAYPYGTLTKSGSVLFGMTCIGGAYDSGCIFSIDTDGTRYKKLLDFNGTNGAFPDYGSLTLLGHTLFGMTSYGGANGKGLIFSIDTNGSGYTDILDFNGTNGWGPCGSLILSGNLFYGTTCSGGIYTNGNIFSIDTSGIVYKDLFDFNGTNGKYIFGDVTLSNGKLFGMTSQGGVNGEGVIFSVDTSGMGYKDLFDFNGANGAGALGSLTISHGVLFGMTPNAGGSYHGGGWGNLFSIDTNGINFLDFNFNYTDGLNPLGSLGLLGNELFGMASTGGTNNAGVIFKLNTNTPLAINNLNPFISSINTYPNPNNGVFTISFGHAELVSASQTSVEVYNVLGEKVTIETLKQVLGDYILNISNQPNGVYFYRVVKEDGSVVGSGKVVIEK